MNICFIVYDFMEPGGINTVVRNIANRLSINDKMSISILDLNPGRPFIEGGGMPGIRYVALSRKHCRYPFQFWLNLIPVFLFLKQEKIDIAFVEGTDAGFFVPPLQPFLKTPLIFCDHGAICNQLDNKKATIIRWMACKFCCHTVALTQKNCDDYVRLFKVKKKNVSVIYNFAECPVAVHYNADSQRIITIGRMTMEKGMDLLLEVANIVLKRNPDWSWDVYGDGPMMKKLIDKKRELGLEKNVHFLGNVQNAVQYMNKYSLYVLPSYREGLPLVLIEALRNRIPAISFDIDTGPRDIIENGVTGFLIPPYNIEQMAKKLEILIKSKAIRSKMSENCRTQIDKFDEERIIKQWEKLIITKKRK